MNGHSISTWRHLYDSWSGIFVKPRRPSHSPRMGTLFFTAAAVVSLVVLFLSLRILAIRRNDSVELAQIQSRNLAYSVDQNISGILKRTDLALNTVVSELEWNLKTGRLDLPRLNRFVSAEERLLPEAVAIRVADEQGQVVLGNPGGDPSVSFANLPAFIYLRAHPKTRFFLEKPQFGLFTKKWVMRSVRSYNHPDGHFGGIVVIPILIEHFQNLLAGFNIGPNGTLTLRDGEGGFIIRHPVPRVPDSRVGEQATSAELIELVRTGVAEATYFTAHPFDNKPRNYSMRRLKEAPLIVGVGLAEADYLGPWRSDRNWLVAILGISLLGIWIATGFLWKAWQSHLRDTGALMESRSRLERAEAIAQFGNWELNLRTGDLRASAGATMIYGLVGEQWQRAEIQSLALPEYRPGLDEAMKNLLEKGQPYDVEYCIHRHGDGELRYIHSQADYDADRKIVFGVIGDNTDVKRAEEKSTRLQSQLHQAQKMESLGILAGGIAHDMNNVLGAILGLASANLETLPVDSRFYRAFSTISKAAARGGDLVKGLLSFSRQNPAEEYLLDVNQVLHEMVRLLERTTLAKVSLVEDLSREPLIVMGDAGALTNALMNLCVNAVDAMPENGTLTLRTRLVDDKEVEVLVQDTGTGMTQDILAKSLDPFFTTKEVGKGTGLGLSMVYSTMKAHKGQLEIQSEPGMGTIVKLRFPKETGKIPAVKSGSSLPPNTSKAFLKVLLVDDDPLVQSATQAVLEALGHHAITAFCGEAAIKILESGDHPDLVILDLNMPGMGGAKTLQLLKSSWPDLPVLLSTGRVDQTALNLVGSYPNVTLLPKPFSMQDLYQKLERLDLIASLPGVGLRGMVD